MKLGLACKINTIKGYAEAERFRELFLDPLGGDYDGSSAPGTDPFGRNGYVYAGDFSYAEAIDQWKTSNSSIAIFSGALRIAASATNGYAYVAFNTTIGRSYTVSVDVTALQSGNAALVQIGTSAGAYAVYNSGNVTSAATKSTTFAATASHYFLSLRSKTNSKWANFDNISIKRA